MLHVDIYLVGSIGYLVNCGFWLEWDLGMLVLTEKTRSNSNKPPMSWKAGRGKHPMNVPWNPILRWAINQKSEDSHGRPSSASCSMENRKRLVKLETQTSGCLIYLYLARFENAVYLGCLSNLQHADSTPQELLFLALSGNQLSWNIPFSRSLSHVNLHLSTSTATGVKKISKNDKGTWNLHSHGSLFLFILCLYICIT